RSPQRGAVPRPWARRSRPLRHLEWRHLTRRLSLGLSALSLLHEVHPRILHLEDARHQIIFGRSSDQLVLSLRYPDVVGEIGDLVAGVVDALVRLGPVG